MVLTASTRLNKENKTVSRLVSRERASTTTSAEPRLIALTVSVREYEASCQTDFMIDRPPTPLFVPAKIGIDVSTEILDGELFDFYKEVEPILEVLIGKTIEMSIMQVLEESELASLRKRQEEFESLRNAELVEVQRMEAAERRRTEEIERRKNQELARVEFERATVKKIVAHRYSKFYLSGILRNCMQTIQQHGKFFDTIESAIEIDFIPSLVQMVMAKTSAMANCMQVANAIVN